MNVRRLAEELDAVEKIERGTRHLDVYGTRSVWSTPITILPRELWASHLGRIQKGCNRSIEIHPSLLVRFDLQDVLRRTFLHEVGHQIAWYEYLMVEEAYFHGDVSREQFCEALSEGRENGGHGLAWKRIMRRMGESTRRKSLISEAVRVYGEAEMRRRQTCGRIRRKVDLTESSV